jgi:hypothetical protein
LRQLLPEKVQDIILLFNAAQLNSLSFFELAARQDSNSCVFKVSSRREARRNSIVPMTEPEEPHPSHLALTEKAKDIDDGLKKLNVFLETVTFRKDKKGVESCSHNGLKEAAWPVLKALGFQDKVPFLLRPSNQKLTSDQINSRRMQCNVLRLRSGTTPLTAPSADLIPVQVWGSNPTIEGRELAPASVTHITKGIKIEVKNDSVFDLLYLVEKKSDTT